MDDKLKKALEVIKNYCATRTGCEGCPFDRDDTCFFALCDLPCDWELGGAE